MQGTDTDPISLTCLHCGYDLRMIQSDVCPECGQTIERDVEQISQIPWSHRRTKGRFRTYLATVWLASFRLKRFRAEMARPVSYRDARAFFRVNATILSLCVMTTLAIFFWHSAEDAMLEFTYLDADRLAQGAWWQRALMFDVLMPLWMGIMFWPLTVVLAGVWVFTSLSLPAWFFASRSLSERERARAVSLAHYASATVVWIPVGVIGAWFAAIGAEKTKYTAFRDLGPEPLFYVFAGLTIFLPFFPPLWVWVRYATFYVSLTRAGFFRSAAMVLGLPVMWVVNLLLFLVLVPWCVGVGYITVRGW
jgi:hypothetical protein